MLAGKGVVRAGQGFQGNGIIRTDCGSKGSLIKDF